MATGQDPDDFLYLKKKYDLLEEMGWKVHDEWYEDIILQLHPAKYEIEAKTTQDSWYIGVMTTEHNERGMQNSYCKGADIPFMTAMQ